MRRQLLLFLLLIGVCRVQAQCVEVEGEQQGVWEADTILVKGNVKVLDSLTVLPGTVVLFDGFYHISVGKGSSFQALGGLNDSVVFTVRDTTGFGLVDSPKGGWNGIQLKGGRLRLDYCVLEYGKAVDSLDKEGGAINIDRGNAFISHSSLRHNYSCDRGGAIHAQDADFRMSSSHVNENWVLTNTGTYAMYGGGACFLRCNVFMEDMEFRKNYGPTCIGGALSLDSCQVDLHGAVFADNEGLNGGGMYIMRNNFTNSTLYNIAFYNNFSRHFAGALAFSDSSPAVYNILVVGNSSEGVDCNGIFFYQYSRPKMTNCIIYGNYPRPENMHDQLNQMWLWTFDDCAPEFRNCLIEGLMDDIMGWNYIQVFENIIDADPLFVDAAHCDFHLRENSPCRDAGYGYVPSELFTGFDLDGLPRVANQRIDIGPYEYSPEAVGDPSAVEAPGLIGNPLGGESRIRLFMDAPETLWVKVYSMDGRCLASKTVASAAGEVELEIGDLVEVLASGVYLIEVGDVRQRGLFKAVK